MIHFLLRLYPAAWRRRYGDEFEVLLGERVIGPFDAVDVLLGAIDAHLHLRGLAATPSIARGYSMSIRIGGVAAIASGVLWLVVALAVLGVFVDWPAQPLVFIVLALSVLVAVAGLSAFQSRHHPWLIWIAFAVPALSSVVSVLAMIGMAVLGDRDLVPGWSSWAIWSVGMFGLVSGSAIFGFVTWRTRILARFPALALGVGGVLSFVLLALGYQGALPDGPGPIMIAALLLTSSGWMGLGLAALRTTRPAAETAAA